MSFEIFEPFNQDRYRSRLPVAFDNSMDLYEQLVSIIAYIDNLTSNGNNVTKEVISLRKQFEQYKIDLDNKVLPTNIITVLEEWISNGKLETVINGISYDEI